MTKEEYDKIIGANGINRCCDIFLFLFLLIVWNIPSFVWIGFAGHNKNEIICHKKNDDIVNDGLVSIIGIFAFIIINAVISLTESMFVFFAVVVSCDDKFYKRFKGLSIFFEIIGIICGIFRFAWLIVGSIMFFKECPNVSPNSLNDVMWAMLIMGFIGFWGTFIFGRIIISYCNKRYNVT